MRIMIMKMITRTRTKRIRTLKLKYNGGSDIKWKQ